MTALDSGMPVQPGLPPVMPLVGDRLKLEKLIGRPLPEEIFTFAPWDHRIVVVREEPLRESVGGIIIPETSQQPPAQGWVVSCGPKYGYNQWGAYDPTIPREAFIGTKILFGKYAGYDLHTGDPKEDEFDTQFVVMTDGDVWGSIGMLPAIGEYVLDY